MSENVYYNRIEFIWKSLGYKDASKFAREIGMARSENILRLKRSVKNEPGIDLVGDILKRFSNVNPLWLIKGEGEPFLSDKNKYSIDETLKVTGEPCQCCERLRAKIEYLNDKLKDKEDVIEALREANTALKGETSKKETIESRAS